MESPNNFSHNCLGFFNIRAALIYTVNVNSCHMALPVICGWERIHLIVVEPVITECDQALMGTAVMPLQMLRRYAKRDGIIKNAVQIIQSQIFNCRTPSGKERSRRHLLRIANNNSVFRS